MTESPKLYTQEHIVFARNLRCVDLSNPIHIYSDLAGNEAIADGNHRSFKAFQEGRLEELTKRKIGTLPFDVSKNENYRQVSELRVIED